LFVFSAGFIEVGGYEPMIQKYFEAYPDTTINNCITGDIQFIYA